MTSPYLARQTWLHALPTGVKLAGLAGLSIALMPVTEWRLIALYLIAAIALYACLGREALRRLAFLR